MKNNAKQKLSMLRAELRKRKLHGFIVPRMSEYQGEFVAPYAERLEWLTGFTGSAGTAIILRTKAVILTDGRYTIQLAQQADKNFYSFGSVSKTSVAKWLVEHARVGDVIGYDPWLMTVRQVEQLQRALEEEEIELLPVKSNPVDAVWDDKPPFPKAGAEIFPKEYAGQAHSQKIESVTQKLKQKKLAACVITLPDSLAWLLNVRGADVEFTPVVLSFGIVHRSGKVEWFVHPEKISPDVRKHLGKNVKIVHPEKIAAKIKTLGRKRVGLDFMRSPMWFKQALGRAAVDFKDPCIEPKAVKNAAEQKALREAHIRDGVAVANFLYWLEHHKGALTEIGIAEKLESFRRQDKAYRGPSFATISGWAGNGAIIHYRATPESNAKISPPGLLLLDSGAQYDDGTTDITRTIAIGKPTAEMKERFTLVLKGHIAVARAKFPEGALGAQIDTMARQPLWSEGLDYAHGTGHGVGCFLSVHEESANLSPRGTEALKAGMFLSNEPGYYKEGAYGIRIESLVLVREEGRAEEEGRKMLGFETFTLAPIDRHLIRKELLSAEELEWLNSYHLRVREILGPRLDPQARSWFEASTAPL